MDVAENRDRWGGGACECGNEPLGSVKCGEFIYWLKNWLGSQVGLCSME
jgi:hypothetical protein